MALTLKTTVQWPDELCSCCNQWWQNKKVFKVYNLCGIYGQTGRNTCQGQCPRWHKVPPVTLEPLCCKLELMFLWTNGGVSETRPQSLLRWSPVCAVWMAFSTTSCLAAGSVVFSCHTGPWVASCHRARLPQGLSGLAVPTTVSLCAEKPAPSSFRATESTRVLFPDTSAWPVSPSVCMLCPKLSFKVSFSPAALCFSSSCITVPSVLSFLLASSSPCSCSPLGSLSSPSHSSSRACLALIRPHGNGAGGNTDRNKDVSLGYVVSCQTPNTKAGLLSMSRIQHSCKSPGITLTQIIYGSRILTLSKPRYLLARISSHPRAGCNPLHRNTPRERRCCCPCSTASTRRSCTSTQTSLPWKHIGTGYCYARTRVASSTIVTGKKARNKTCWNLTGEWRELPHSSRKPHWFVANRTHGLMSVACLFLPFLLCQFWSEAFLPVEQEQEDTWKSKCF